MSISRMARIALIGALAAIACATAASGTAVASRGIRTASGVTLFVTARGSATMTFTRSGLTANVICPFDLLIGFNYVNKSVGEAAFFIANVGSTIGNCSGGASGTIDDGPLAVYLSFGGSLPSAIASITAAASWSLTMTGGTTFGSSRCQYTGRYTFTMNGPGTSFNSTAFSSGSITTLNAGCFYSTGTIRSGPLTMYANASLGTTLTSIAVVLF